jgi:hypothetical protein
VGPSPQDTFVHAEAVPVLTLTLNFTPPNALLRAWRTNLAVSLLLMYSVMGFAL